jgi:hypothetical protein
MGYKRANIAIICLTSQRFIQTMIQQLLCEAIVQVIFAAQRVFREQNPR